jgi:signal transduction histidine kinase
MLAENFTRHESKGRFVPVCEVGSQSDEMAASVAECLSPFGDDLDSPAFDLNEAIQYMLTEIANNVRQHSRGRGFVSAQLRSSEGLVRLAIADNGIGILESFRAAGFDWAAKCDHAAAIEQALQPRVSSRGRPTNEGVGLSTTIKLAELYGGWFAVISGNGCVRGWPGKAPVCESLPPGTRYQGTLLTLALRAEQVREYPEMLSRAKIALGILPKDFCGGRFSP